MGEKEYVGPLSGVRVLDLSRLLPGPYCSMLLRDLGAEVIKVEDSDGGDYSRYYPPLLNDSNSAAFHALNRGKKSVIINLKTEPGKKQLHALISTSHVLIETFRPGVLEKLGFSVSSLRERYPSLVICSISGYGQHGVDSLRAGHDLNYLARAGVLGMMKHPTVLPIQVADIAAGSYPAAIQIIAALRQAERHGKGCYIDVSMTDGAYSMLVMALAKYAANHSEVGNGKDVLSGHYPCYDVYRSKDGYISVGNLEPKFWNEFVKVLHLKEIADGAYSEGEEAKKVREIIQRKLSSKTNDEWKKVFENVDTCVEPIYPPENRAENDPQLKTRHLNIPIKVADQTISIVKTPLNMSGIQHASQAAPKYGEHTKQILDKLKAKL